MSTGSSNTALSVGPTVIDYVSLIWKINMMGVPLEIPLETDDNDNVEQRLAYWREDIGVNLYHWHWHQVHPVYGPDYVVNKDRRGELFYYLHQQILARYNVERLCHGFNVTHPLVDWDKPISEPYYPILNAYISSKDYPSRLAKMKLSNVNRINPPLKVNVDDLRIYKERIFEAIYRKKIIAADGTEISLDNDRGIDILGNMIESTSLSPNENYYGNIHNQGHILISLIHDPENNYNQTTGVMFTPNTAMRDPLFYTWHTFLNSFFDQHKASLPTYDKKILTFPHVQVANVDLVSHRNGQHRKEKNTLHTYMTKSDFNMLQGLDFIAQTPALVRMTHQNHDDFHYIIESINNAGKQLLGTVRIFLLPDIGFGNSSMRLSEQRSMAIEMDRFVQPLKPGVNKIVRRSTMASVTIPFEQSFRERDDVSRFDSYEEFQRFQFCGCGWPQHLLVPRGTAKGYPMLLFVMITDANEDRIDPTGDINSRPNECKPSDSVCGLMDKKYPDKRPAGFPFDRPTRNDVDTSVADFLTPNMAVKPITIFHSDKVRPGRLLSNDTPVILKTIYQET